ncbi:MAG: glycosyltransferase WbuB [Candidatus Thorarchaeota archaeon]|nr:MAG: glycosyltransferase WbuB [Candidatus Thorarchaeota archaeon]
MRAKRAAFFVEHFPPYLGSDRTIFELGKRLPSKGYKVHYIVTQPLRYLLGRRPENWSYKKNWETGPPNVGKNISARYLLVPKILERLWIKTRILALPFTLLYFLVLSMGEIIRFKPDIVISAHATPIVGVVAAFSSRLLRKPLIMGCPDWMTAYAVQLSGGKLTDVGPIFLQTLEVFLIRLARSSFTVTHYMKRILSSLGIRKDSIKVIPNGVDSDVFSDNFNQIELKKEYGLDGRIVVLYSGHIEDWAGVAIVETLTKRMASELPEAILFFVGAGEAVDKVIALVENTGVSNQFCYGGMKPFSEMPRIIASADIALCIFPDSPVSHAASPLKLFEYMGCGKAIVATSVAGTVEALTQDAGCLMEPGNIDEICDKVLELCKDPEQRKEIGHKARDLVVHNYSWSVLSDELATLIAKTINNEKIVS